MYYIAISETQRQLDQSSKFVIPCTTVSVDPTVERKCYVNSTVQSIKYYILSRHPNFLGGQPPGFCRNYIENPLPITPK